MKNDFCIYAVKKYVFSEDKIKLNVEPNLDYMY